MLLWSLSTFYFDYLPLYYFFSFLIFIISVNTLRVIINVNSARQYKKLSLTLLPCSSENILLNFKFKNEAKRGNLKENKRTL